MKEVTNLYIKNLFIDFFKKDRFNHYEPAPITFSVGIVKNQIWVKSYWLDGDTDLIDFGNKFIWLFKNSKSKKFKVYEP